MTSEENTEPLPEGPSFGERATDFFQSTATSLDLKNFINPFFNPYEEKRELNGQSMDYFGYYAQNLSGTLPVGVKFNQ
jgi:hypothetical protein